MNIINYIKKNFDPQQDSMYNILLKNDLLAYDMITVSFNYSKILLVLMIPMRLIFILVIK